MSWDCGGVGSRPGLVWLFWRGVGLACLLSVLACLAGCDRQDRDKRAAQTAAEPLLDAEPARGERPSGPAKRCRRIEGDQGYAIRAGGEGEPVELGGAARTTTGFAVGVLRRSSSAVAGVALVDGRGGGRVVEVQSVHGPVEPPQVVAGPAGPVGVVVDSDASAWTLRLFRLDSMATSAAELVRGPEVRKARRGDLLYSVAVSEGRGLLVWEEHDKTAAFSRLVALPFDARTLEASGPERTISPEREDSGSPLLTPRAGGFYLTWVHYPELDPGQEAAQESRLVDEPSGQLRTVPLDDAGKFAGPPLPLTKQARTTIVFDAASHGDDLIVAFRGLTSGRPDSAVPVELRWIAADGTVDRRSLGHDELGPGAPSLMLESPAELLVTRGPGSSVLTSPVGTPGEARELEPTPGLFGHDPLVGGAGALLAAQWRGLDVELSTFECSAAEATP